MALQHLLLQECLSAKIRIGIAWWYSSRVTFTLMVGGLRFWFRHVLMGKTAFRPSHSVRRCVAGTHGVAAFAGDLAMRVVCPSELIDARDRLWSLVAVPWWDWVAGNGSFHIMQYGYPPECACPRCC
jgi:hypothetical protein